MRAYEVEDFVFRRRTQETTMREAKAIAGRLFDHFGLEPIELRHARRGHRGGSMFYYPHQGRPPRIHLGRVLDWIVCHEVAHYAADPDDRGHGKVWAGLYVEAVRGEVSAHYAHRLDLNLRKRGIHPTPVEPVTPV